MGHYPVLDTEASFSEKAGNVNIPAVKMLVNIEGAKIETP